MVNLPRKQAEGGLYGPVWKEINGLIDYLRSITPTAGRGVRINRTTNGATYIAEIPKAQPGTPGVVSAFTVISVHADHLVCADYETSEQRSIAKPWRIRRTPFDGQTITETDESGDTYDVQYEYLSNNRRMARILTYEEEQVVVPRYRVGDLIFASESSNGTGVSGVDYIDLNHDGRYWARRRA